MSGDDKGRRFVPFTIRDGGDAWSRALADITARHEQHKADIQRTSDRLDRVARLLGEVGAVS